MWQELNHSTGADQPGARHVQGSINRNAGGCFPFSFLSLPSLPEQPLLFAQLSSLTLSEEQEQMEPPPRLLKPLDRRGYSPLALRRAIDPLFSEGQIHSSQADGERVMQARLVPWVLGSPAASGTF